MHPLNPFTNISVLALLSLFLTATTSASNPPTDLTLSNTTLLETFPPTNHTNSLSARKPATAQWGWVGWYNGKTCDGTNGRAGSSHQLRDKSCLPIAPSTDTIGIYWGSKDKGTNVDDSVTQLKLFTDGACKNPAGWEVWRPQGWANGGPMACWSMDAFKGPKGEKYAAVMVGKYAHD